MFALPFGEDKRACILRCNLAWSPKRDDLLTSHFHTEMGATPSRPRTQQARKPCTLREMAIRERASRATPRRIIVVDDQELVRRSIRRVLEHNDIRVIGEEPNGGQTLIDLCKVLKPEVLLMDVGLPGTDGIEEIQHLRAVLKYDLCVLILSGTDDLHTVLRALRAGARGFISKTAPVPELIAAIETVSNGRQYVPKVFRRAVKEALAESANAPLLPDGLAPREIQVLRGIAEGKTTKEIASELLISSKTVDSHRLNLRRKLQLRSNMDLVRFAVRHGITPNPKK